MKKSERPERAEAFAAGFRKAKMKGACTALIEVLKNDSQKEYVSPWWIARYYALMGDRDHTFEWLEKGYAERSALMVYIKAEDSFEPFRSDPRYIDLLKRMGMPQSPASEADYLLGKFYGQFAPYHFSGRPHAKIEFASVFADHAKPNGAGAKGQQFPRHVLVLDDQFHDFAFGCFEKPVESRVMLLHAGVTQVVTDSARKRLQPQRPVKFESSAATRWTEQAQALTTSARRHHSELKAKPQAGQSIR